MKKAGHEALDQEQSFFLTRLNEAVTQINQADDLLAKNTGVDAATKQATGLLLSAIGRVYILQTAEQHGLNNRLHAFTKK